MEKKLNKKPTFADRAKEIMAKYERFKDDPISRRSMDLELTELAKEQEAERAKMGYGGNMKKMAGGGPLEDITDPFGIFAQLQNPLDKVEVPYSRGVDFSDVGVRTDGPRTEASMIPLREGMTSIESKSASELDLPVPSRPDTIPGPPPKVFESAEYNFDGMDGGRRSKATTAEDLAGSPDKVGLAGMLGGIGSAYQLFDAIRNKEPLETYDRVDPAYIDATVRKIDARNTMNAAFNNQRGVQRETSQTGGQRIANAATTEAARRNKIGSALAMIQEDVDNKNSITNFNAQQVNAGIQRAETIARAQDEAQRKNTIGTTGNILGGLYAGTRGEQGLANTTYNQNIRLINAINSGVLRDYNISDLLNLFARQTA
jgi:hypothetical protein